jgi:tRNA (mo5U34)-methyltransferase
MANDPFSYVREMLRLREAKGWWFSFDFPDGTKVEGVSTLEIQKKRIEAFPIPADLTGKRVLDIGTWDGWFAFEMERRGADVVAVDCWDNPRFREAHRRLSSRVDYRLLDMYELTPERIGRFDVVIFMGVLYHLKHPLLALELVCALTTGMAAVDSFVVKEEHRPGADIASRPFMEFYENDELGGQIDNWCGPTVPCLLAMCRTAGFARVELQAIPEHSASVACYRHWLPPAPAAAPGPELLYAYHARNYGINFDNRYDELITCYFRPSGGEVKREDLKPEVGGFGVIPISVIPESEGVWRADFKVPPGLTPGWHEVRLRLGQSRPGNETRIAVDVPLAPGRVVVTAVSDGTTWRPGEFDPNVGDVVSLWVDGLPENADVHNVRVFLDSTPLTTVHVKDTQVNAQMPRSLPAGPAEVRLETGGVSAAPVPLTVLPRC